MLVLAILPTIILFAQEEAHPMSDVKIERKLSYVDIEGDVFQDVTAKIQSISPDYIISSNYRVKIKIEDSNGKVIFKKKLKNSFLYVFSNGQIQIGRRNFNTVIIYKNDIINTYHGVIRLKEGVY